MRDITDFIQRREDIEERLGFEFKGLFASIDDKGNVNVNGELHAIDGREPDANLFIITNAKDSMGRVLHVAREYVSINNFYQLKTFLQKFSLSEFKDSLETLLIYIEKV